MGRRRGGFPGSHAAARRGKNERGAAQSCGGIDRGPPQGREGAVCSAYPEPRAHGPAPEGREYLRFQSSLEQRISELIMLIVSREWTQHFEWSVHVPLGRKAGLAGETIDAIAEGRRPSGMPVDEEIVYDFCDELLRTKGVSETTYRHAVKAF